LFMLNDTLEARAVFTLGHLDPSMVTPVFATLFVDKVAKAVVLLVLINMMDVHRVVDVITSESGHYHTMNKAKLVDRRRIYSAMPASV